MTKTASSPKIYCTRTLIDLEDLGMQRMNYTQIILLTDHLSRVGELEAQYTFLKAKTEERYFYKNIEIHDLQSKLSEQAAQIDELLQHSHRKNEKIGKQAEAIEKLKEFLEDWTSRHSIMPSRAMQEYEKIIDRILGGKDE